MKNTINNISKEVHILRQISHEGIVKMYEYGDDSVIDCNSQVVHNKVYIVMEYVQGPLLFDICKENPKISLHHLQENPSAIECLGLDDVRRYELPCF